MNPDVAQFDAAQAYGWDAYWSQDEDTRALMCWHIQANKLIDALQSYDSIHAKD